MGELPGKVAPQLQLSVQKQGSGVRKAVWTISSHRGRKQFSFCRWCGWWSSSLRTTLSEEEQLSLLVHQSMGWLHWWRKQKQQRYVRFTVRCTTKASPFRRWDCCRRDKQGHPPSCSFTKVQSKADADWSLHFAWWSHQNSLSWAKQTYPRDLSFRAKLAIEQSITSCHMIHFHCRCLQSLQKA